MTQTKIGVGMINATSIGDAKVLQGDGAWVTPSSGSHQFISTVEASSSGTIDITFTPGDADTFVIYLEGLLPASDGPEFHIKTAPDGSTFDTSGYSWGNICLLYTSPSPRD